MDERLDCPWPLAWKEDLKDKHPLRSMIELENESTYNSENVEEVTKKFIRQAERFFPDLHVIGKFRENEIRNDTNEWFYRVLHEKNEDRLCIQYLWIFTEQKVVIEALFASFPILAFLWSSVLYLFFGNALRVFRDLFDQYGVYGILLSLSNLDTAFVVISTIFSGTVLIIVNLFPYLGDYRRGGRRFKLRFRSITLGIGFGIGIILSAWFTHPLMIVLTIVFIFIILGWFFGAASHDMDYAPVFVFLKKDATSPDGWVFDCAYWDMYHYNSDHYCQPTSTQNVYLTSNTRIQLEIETPFHDFALWDETPSMWKSKWSRIWKASVLTLALTIILSIFDIIPNTLILFETLFFIGFYLLVLEKQPIKYEHLKKSHLRIFQDEELQKRHHLSSTRLHIFWNWQTKKGKLIIIEKMKNPFRKDKNWLSKFGDPTDEISFAQRLRRLFIKK